MINLVTKTTELTLKNTMNKIDKAIDFLVEDEPLFNNPIAFNDKWLDDHVNGTWNRGPDGKIDVDGSVQIYGISGLTKLPYQFGRVSEYFNCAENDLITLEGAPTSVGDSFDCTANMLTNLVGGPQEVADYYYAYGNPLESLEGVAPSIGGRFDAKQFTHEDYLAYVKERDG